MHKEYQTLSENETSRDIFNLRLEEQELAKKIESMKVIFESPMPESIDEQKRLKKQRQEKVIELQELQEQLKKLINSLGHLGKEIPVQSEPVYEELKNFNLDVIEGYKQKLAQLKEARQTQ